jgi:hypothetical protein
MGKKTQMAELQERIAQELRETFPEHFGGHGACAIRILSMIKQSYVKGSE